MSGSTGPRTRWFPATCSKPSCGASPVWEGIDQVAVTRILDGVGRAALDRAVYRGAGLLPMPYLRGLEVLHFEAAMRLDTTAVLTYDHRLGKAARAVGLQVIAPGTAYV